MSAPPTSSPRRGGDEARADARPDEYARFVATVARRQLTAWLPERQSRVLDISREISLDSAEDLRVDTGVAHRVGTTIARAGHRVFRVEHPTCPAWRPSPEVRGGTSGVTRIVGDPRSLDWFRSGSFDAVVAEGGALSSCLATETTVAQVARLLRPGGSLLMTVESLVHGLARLAEQHRWSELADAGAADVVLVPGTDEPGLDEAAYTRCFGVDELRELVTDAGFSIDWIRPRTVLPPDVVTHALRDDPGCFDALVASELDLAVERQGESSGRYLTVSATRP